MIPGALILTDPKNISTGGYLAVPESDDLSSPVVKVSRVYRMGEIPTRYALLTNAAFGVDRPPRFLGGRYFGTGTGMNNVLALLSELGADVYKEKFGKGNQATTTHVPRPDAFESTARIAGQFFVMLWKRMQDLEIPLFDERHRMLHDTMADALAAHLVPLEWRLAHKNMPEALQVGNSVDSWVSRPLPFRTGQKHRIIRRSPFWLAEKIIEMAVPFPKWSLASSNGTGQHTIYQGTIDSVPKEWDQWWTPGIQGSSGGKRHRERVLWSCAEWHWARDIGADVSATKGFDCEEERTFAEAFPKAARIMARLSRRSWIDGWIALAISQVGSLPLDRANTTSPYALWVRGISLVWQMRWARMIQEDAHKNNLPIQVAGYGMNKIHVQHALSDEEWITFSDILILHGCYPLPAVVGVAGDSLEGF